MTTRLPARRLVAALAALALALIAAVVPARPAHAASESTLTVGSLSQVSTFNPFLAYAQGELDPINLMYPSLLWPDAHGNPSKYLADSWSTSPDRLTWTFKIHPGLKWTDGEPLTAKDIAWTLELIRTNPTAGTANGQLLTNFASVTAPDDTTVVVKTKAPQANMLYTISLPIVPQHVWQSKVSTLAAVKNTSGPIVGYGPFSFSDYKTEQFTVLKANKHFFQGAPKYDRLVLQYFKNNDAAVAALRSGQVDQIDRITPTEYRSLEKVGGITTYPQIGYRWTGIEINPGARTKSGKKIGTGHPALADPVVRKAIVQAIDKKTLVTKVLNGLGQVGAGYLPPAFPDWFWTPDKVTGYDPAAADAALDAAGYTKGSDGIRKDPKSGRTLSFRLGTHSDTTTDSQIASYLTGWLKKVGIAVKVEPMSSTTLNADLAKGDWDMLMDGWGTSPDPTYLLGIQTCSVLPDDKGENGNTDAFFCDPAYDKLYTQQQQELDPAKRQQMIKQMEQILYDANVDVILFYQNILSAVRTDAKQGFITGKPNAQGLYPFQNYQRAWRVASPPSSSDDGGSSTGAIIGIVVAVVVVLLIVGFFLLRRRSTAADRE